MTNRLNDPQPSSVDSWLTATFPHRHCLRSEIAAELGGCAPLPVDAPDKSFLGNVVEHAIGLNLCARAPYVRLFNCLSHDQAIRLLSMAGYAPGTHAAVADYASWWRGDCGPHPSRLFTVACRLAYVRDLLHGLDHRRSDANDVARMLLGRHPGLLCARPSDVFHTRPAFRHMWASYTSGFEADLRSYGPSAAQLRLLGGSRHADFLLGTTLLEVKSGRLDQDHYLDSLINQLLVYVVLAHSDGHSITHMAVYAARYQRLLRFPVLETLNRLAGSPVDLDEAGIRLSAVVQPKPAPEGAA
ncbi:hypothetical protein [Asanoa sp. NPDC050611]|uniref:hypothetical protein n=1 Tax=Asanoa sp. NPDC050611 TaxID=3157098 RepID=UPI00340A90DE